jgi:hypothetical protein
VCLCVSLCLSYRNMTAFKSSASEVMAKVKAALESVQQCHIRLSEVF